MLPRGPCARSPSGLQFPEGPDRHAPTAACCWSRSSAARCRASRRTARVTVVAETGGGPNGAAIGPDGAIYVCNNGGFEWHDVGGLTVPGDQPDDYTGGSIQRVDLATGRVETLYTACDGHPLRGPNDLVFDAAGGFWFTDHGKTRERERDRGGLYYARPDGSLIREVVFPLDSAERRRPLARRHAALRRGDVHRSRVAVGRRRPGRGRRAACRSAPGRRRRCSAACRASSCSTRSRSTANGNVCVATLVNGGITVIAPDGEIVEHVGTGDPLTTNICFGGPDLRTAYVTCSGTGPARRHRLAAPGPAARPLSAGPLTGSGRVDQSQSAEAGTVEPAVPGEQRIGLLERVGADQEIGDDTCPIGRAAPTLASHRWPASRRFGGKRIEAEAERPERVATVIVVGEMRAHLGPHDVTCHQRPGSIRRPQRVAGRLAEGGIGPEYVEEDGGVDGGLHGRRLRGFAPRFASGVRAWRRPARPPARRA